MALRGIQLGLRAWEFLFSVLIMALIGNMIASAFSGNPATVNYSMYTATFSIVSLFYLIPASINLNWAIHPLIMIVLDALNAIFFLSCAIALGARLHARDCSNDKYTLFNEITNGAHNREKRCREAQASTAFLWLAWAGYMASLIVSILMARGEMVSLRGRGARAPRGRPSMAQV